MPAQTLREIADNFWWNTVDAPGQILCDFHCQQRAVENERQWIPVSDRLPGLSDEGVYTTYIDDDELTDSDYEMTCRHLKREVSRKTTFEAQWNGRCWYSADLDDEFPYKVVAWMPSPLPAPYSPEKGDSK